MCSFIINRHFINPAVLADAGTKHTYNVIALITLLVCIVQDIKEIFKEIF